MDDTKEGKFTGTKTQLLAAIFGTLFAISDGINYGWTSPMIPYLLSNKSPIKTTKYEAEWLESCLMIGSFVGLPLTIFLVDKLGRKKSLLLASTVALLSWIAVALATNMTILFVARFVFGVTANTSFVAAPMYIAEMADHKIRGFLSSIVYLHMLIGLVIINCVGPYLPFYVPPVIGIIILSLELIVFPFMPETPYYLIYHDKNLEAKKSLQYFRPGKNVDEELSDIVKAVTRQKAEKGSLKDLFVDKGNRKALTIMSVLNAGQHLSGISVILMNLDIILDAAGTIYLDAPVSAIIFSVIMLFAAYTSSLRVDKFGRRSLLLSSITATTVCLAILSIYFHLKFLGYDVRLASWIPIVAVMFYAACFKMGLGIVPIVLTAELFPANVKAIGMTIADLMYVFGSIISIQLYQWLGNYYGLHVPFYVFTVFSILIFLYTYFFIPETKGKTLEEIQYVLKGEPYPVSNSLESLVSNSSKSYRTF